MQQVTGNGDWYFPETKKTVSGEFLDFYQNTQDYMLKLGFPITDVEDHPVLPGVKVQYFQKARLELFPNEPAGKRVRLASLGNWLYDATSRGVPANLPFAAGVCRVFSPSDIAVCYEFLRFYDTHDGPTYFGDPISVMEKMPNGRLIQYFERARMEWWPEYAQGQRVVLTSLGTLYSMQNGNPPLDDIDGDKVIQSDYRLRAYAFTATPLVSPNGNQTVYVIVTNQLGEPVEDTLVTLVVHLPNGTNVNHRLGETNAKGLTHADFNVGNLKPNQVIQVDVEAKGSDGTITTTSTYFRIWW